MVRRAAGALLFFFAGCADLDPAVLYRCEEEGACLQAGFSCWSDGYCRPNLEPPAGGGAGGGETGGGGGAIGGGGGGGAIGGGGGATGGGGGATGGGGGETGGGGGATGGGGGANCTACPASFCGYFDAGCAETFCGFCAAGNECGVSRPNRCDVPRICSAEGWCFENPLPQGHTIRGAWVAGPREVYFVGDNATALLWNGERHSVVALPPVPEGTDFHAVHGTSPQDFFIVGTRGLILHFDGVSWSQELIEGGSSQTLRSVLARPGQDVIAAGTGNLIVRRVEDAGWVDDALTDGLLDFGDLAEGTDGRMYALGTYSVLPRVSLMREGDAGAALRIWNRDSRPPLITGNSMWVSPDGGFFVAGVADGGAGLPGVGMILKRAEDAGWDELVRVPEELRVLRGLTSDELFAAGDNGLFVYVLDGGARVARLGQTWHALALLDAGPIVEGQWGQVARFNLADAGLTPMSSATTLRINGVCGASPAGLFAASQGTPGCTGNACSALSLVRTPSGQWSPVPLTLPDTSEFIACASGAADYLAGDDTPYFVNIGGTWVDQDRRSLVGSTRSAGIWLENGASTWITNSTQPLAPELPFVTHYVGGSFSPSVRRVRYDGGGDLLTVMAGGWALGERGLAFVVAADGGLEPAARLGSDDFTAMAEADLLDGGRWVIAAGRNGALYRQEGTPGFVDEGPLTANLFAAWAGPNGDAFMAGSEVDAGRVHSRVFRKVDAGWVSVPLQENQPLRTVWAGPADGGLGVWIGGPGGLILRRDL